MAIYFKNLTIDNFRGIKHLELKNFSSINFILGENNTGKTSIYELMSSIQAPTKVNFLAKILRCVSSNKIELRDFKELIPYPFSPANNFFSYSFINDLGDDIKVIISFKFEEFAEEGVELKIYRNGVLERNILDNEFPLYKTNIEFLNNHKLFKPDYFLNEFDIHYNPLNNFHMAINNNAVKELVLSILKKINENIYDICISKKSDQVVVLSKKDGKTITQSLNCFGNGIIKMLELFDNIINAKNGVLLLENWDYSFSKNNKELIFALVKQLIKDYNIQLFLTTYDNETMEIFLDKDNGSLEDISIYTLRKHDGKNYIRYLSGEEASTDLEAFALDLLT